VEASSIDLTVERNVLTVHAQRDRVSPEEGDEMVIGERPYGTFSRQLFLGESLDTDRIDADYAEGVLTVTIPIAERAKPRRVAIGGADGGTTPIEAHAEDHVAAEA
jgi:HSP20 family protein